MSQPGPPLMPPQPSSRIGCLLVGLVLLLALLVLAVLAVGWAMRVGDVHWFDVTSGQTHPAVGKRLPALHLEPLTPALHLEPLTLEGAAITLPELAGRVVLVNFWGTWCPPCRNELPHIAAIEKKYRNDRSVRILPVSCGRGIPEDLDTLRADTAALLREQDIDMPTYTDANQVSRQAFDEIGTFEGYPTTFILDQQGFVRGVWVGPIPDAERQIERLLEKLRAESH